MSLIETLSQQLTVKQLKDILARIPKERDNEPVYAIVNGKRHAITEINDPS